MISLKNTLKAITRLLNDVPHYTLLWTNPNPTSSFSAQTISLDLSKYDQVEIVFKQTAGSTALLTTKSMVGMNGKMLAYGYSDARELDARAYEVTTSGIKFNAGYWILVSDSTGTANANYCTPYKIYGIKFGGGYKALRSLFAKGVAVC